jgi:outer membrane receptor protein involved in Fe transport
MVINGGLRYDLFSVGNQLDASEVENRIRDQWSPRIGIAYPISDRDVFSFHYGRFSQIPDRRVIFEDRGAAVQTRGNPNLENETTVAYQAALQHMFAEDVFGQFSVYFKDIFGLLTIEEVRSGDSPALVAQYTNKDYASSRGFEVSLTKRFTKNFAGELSYTYGIATGVASDPNVQQQVDFLYLPIAEQPLNWDQRHTVSANATIAQPGNWSANFVWTFGTGFPYTPRDRNQRKEDPLLTNSKRLPSNASLTIQAEKHYKLWGQEVKLFVRGNNVLDAQNISDIDPGHFPNPPQAGFDDYRIYYTETGRAGGAYLGDDLNEDGIQDWVALNDPRVFGEGRNIRVGVGVKF